MDLKERLNRIYGKPSAPVPARPSRVESGPASPSAAARLAEVLGGEWRYRASGRTLMVERFYGENWCHGGIPLADLYGVDPKWVAVLAGNAGFAGFDPERTLFLDTETTGLAGGAGTYVFLVGIGSFQAGRFRIRQLFLPDFDSEPAFLQEFLELLRGQAPGSSFRYLVSFNGKSYDLNLLENRLVLQRLERPFRELDHLDLLYPSRALWRGQFEDCALQTLERRVLSLRRRGDIPSFLIPRLYFDYLREGRLNGFREVFEHNRLDLLTLVSLLTCVGKLLESPRPGLPLDPVSAARLVAMRGNLEEAAGLLQQALSAGRWAHREADLRLELALLSRRLGRGNQALGLLRQVLRLHPHPPLQAFEEAAKILEHERRDFEAALDIVRQGLEFYPHCPEFLHRRHRLLCRRQGKKWY